MYLSDVCLFVCLFVFNDYESINQAENEHKDYY